MQSTTAKQSVELREPCRVGGGRIGEIRRIKGTRTARPKESMTGIHRGSQRSGSLLGSDLDSLHISYSQGAWCSCGIPKSGSRSGQMILTKISIKLKLTKTTKNNDLIMKTSASLLICLLLQTKVSAILWGIFYFTKAELSWSTLCGG